MNVDFFDLERFKTAQDSYDTYNTALQEIKDGYKQSHWMWYVFPQIEGLGYSSMSKKYSIKSLLEAMAYFRHETLGTRLYEAMKVLPVFGNAEEIFGRIDAMKLRSCLTLFDLVSPNDIFEEFLGNYFNKERCNKTLQIVASELSYYAQHNAFKRNGIINEVPRAFLEGIDCSERLSFENCLGTILDLLRKGESMRMLISHHLWEKEDFSYYRISNIEFRIQRYMLSFFQEIANFSKDKALLKELQDIYRSYEMAKVEQLFDLADDFDKFWNQYNDDTRVKPIIDSYIKESLCKPNK